MATKITIIVLCALLGCCFASTFHTSYLSPKSARPIRVRTQQELEQRSRQNESVILDFVGLVNQHKGYTAEEHSVTTEDGYILTLHRISGSPLSPRAKGKPVVYLQHGLFGSSEFMTVLGPGKALPYVLADAGYDVWQGNVRGNSLSRSHLELSPENSTFWDYSMDDIACKDLPKLIDATLEKSEQSKLTYIGYSMGTILGYMLLADKPEYNDKVKLFINLGPAVYFLHPYSDNFNSVVFTTGLLANSLLDGSSEILPQSANLTRWAKETCDSDQPTECSEHLSRVADIDSMNLLDIPTIMSYSPAGSSYRTVEHYQQVIKSYGKLLKYDYGCISSYFYCANQIYYDAKTPPEYDLTKVTVPSVILHAPSDYFVTDNDVQYLQEKLSNVVLYEKINDPNFNHLDFVWSTKAKKLVYDRVVQIMSEHSS